MNSNFNRLLLILCILQYTSAIQAQKYIVLTDTIKDKLWIGKNIEYLKDDTETLTIEEVSSKPFASKFIPCNQEAPNFGNVEIVIWNRFTIINRSTKQWILTEWNISIDTLSLYYKAVGTKWTTVHSGRSISMGNRPFFASPYVFELPISPNDTVTFYLKVHSFITQYPLTISSTKTSVKDSYHNNLFNGLFFGLIVSVMIYNLALYFILYDKNYLVYTIYLIILGLMMAELNGVYAFLLGNRFHFLHNAGPSLVALDSLVFILFSTSLLDLERQMRRVYKFYWYICIPASLCIIILNFFGRNLEASISNQLLGLFLLLTMSVVAFLLYRRGYKLARFYLIACVSYFLGVVCFVLKTMAILPFNFLTHNAMQIGCAIMIVMFSVALGDRFRAIRREKAEAQERLVQIRFNYERELHSIEQEVQEHTRDQIAQELHDNIGQLLILMKLQIEKEKSVQPTIVPALAQVSATLRTLIEQVRLLSHALSHNFISDAGLQRSISHEVQRLRALGKFTIQFETDDKEPVLSKDVRIVAFRIFQEALNNALRHAQASNICITLLGENNIYLQIRDDGIGFNKEEVLRASTGLGLKNMFRRASLTGLQCSIITEPHKGCVFTLTHQALST